MGLIKSLQNAEDGLTNAWRSDVERNRGNTKGLIIVSAFRAARALHLAGRKNILFRCVALPFLVFYKLFFDYMMGVYIPYETEIGPGLVVYHGIGLVINPRAVIGQNCTLRQGVTIGSKDEANSAAPRIGNNVNIGANVLVLGDLEIGDGATLGGGAVVVDSVPAGGVAVGNPARLIS